MQAVLGKSLMVTFITCGALHLALISPAQAQTNQMAVSAKRVIVKKGHMRIVAPGVEKQDYTKSVIDLRGYESGTLVIDIKVGRGASAASFDLFPEGVPLPTVGRPTGVTLAGSYDIQPGRTSTLRYDFTQPQWLIFGADGNWGSPKGSRNDIAFTAYVVKGKKRSGPGKRLLKHN